jgi:dGTPase
MEKVVLQDSMNDFALQLHARERQWLASYAMQSSESAGRHYREPPHAYRGPFQRDRDRILHCTAFRRLAGKMQVFTDDMGSYHRTRLTHTFEVASIARTISRVLQLNEDLVEALALMHDIGHPPYGHCGEDVLDECLQPHGRFSHNGFALTIVQQLEQRAAPYPGLNLTIEVLGGQQLRDEKEVGQVPVSPLLEVQVVDAADSIAYDAHDTDDALQLGLISMSDLQGLAIVERARQHLTDSPPTLTPRDRPALIHALIDLQVTDLLQHAFGTLQPWQRQDRHALAAAGVRLEHSPTVAQEREALEDFLFHRVYRHPRLQAVRHSAGGRLEELFDGLTKAPDRLPLRFRRRSDSFGIAAAVVEYLAGMTDRFCDRQFAALRSQSGPLADWS